MNSWIWGWRFPGRMFLSANWLLLAACDKVWEEKDELEKQQHCSVLSIITKIYIKDPGLAGFKIKLFLIPRTTRE